MQDKFTTIPTCCVCGKDAGMTIAIEISDLPVEDQPYCRSCGRDIHVRMFAAGARSVTLRPIPISTEIKRQKISRRFWPKVKIAGDDECWEWTASRNVQTGYGQFSVGGRPGHMTPAHNVCWELLRGPIPDGLELDHLCSNRACVNPNHLEPVTHRENILRCNAPHIVAHRENRCCRGHEMTPENSYWRKSKRGIIRQCLACVRKNRMDYYYRKVAREKGRAT